MEAGIRHARTRLDRTLFSCSLPADEVERASGIASTAIEGMRRVLAKRLPRADATAQMLVALVHGIMQHREAIDDELAALAPHWPMERQSAVDRNILRMAAYELMRMPETPRAVVMNEAIEIAKRYSTAESSQFVNGVLAAVAARAEALQSDRT